MYVIQYFHLPSLRFHCIGGSWDRTQGCCGFGIDIQTSYHHSARSHPHEALWSIILFCIFFGEHLFGVLLYGISGIALKILVYISKDVNVTLLLSVTDRLSSNYTPLYHFKHFSIFNAHSPVHSVPFCMFLNISQPFFQLGLIV
jgi:hypothetical protein